MVATLNASMLIRTPRSMRQSTKPMALTEAGLGRSPNHAKVQAMIVEAREDIGYHRPDFIRVERPEDMAPGTLMGRFRVKVPTID